jgi:hypothetical protein
LKRGAKLRGPLLLIPQSLLLVLRGETSIRCGYYDNTQTNKLYF